jgi:hypothetical protein
MDIREEVRLKSCCFTPWERAPSKSVHFGDVRSLFPLLGMKPQSWCTVCSLVIVQGMLLASINFKTNTEELQEVFEIIFIIDFILE